MKNTFIVSAILILLVSLTSCTDNTRAKLYGGNKKLELPENMKLVAITWKAGDLWYLTKPMGANDSAETYTFQEESSFGIIEGSVTIVETRKK